jgi:hypothetical protein
MADDTRYGGVESSADKRGREIRVATPDSAPNIVLAGRFNPAIFQPAWMAAHNLIRKEEADKAKSFVVLPDLLTFGTSWFHIQVTDDRFEILGIEGGHEAPLRDLVIGIFALLEHTPFERMGLNYYAHFRLDSDLEWQRIARRLINTAPLEGLLTESRLQTVTVGGRHAGAPGAQIAVRVEPSIRITPGLFVATNEHYEDNGVDAGRRLMEILKRRWDGALSYAYRVTTEVHSLRHEDRK